MEREGTIPEERNAEKWFPNTDKPPPRFGIDAATPMSITSSGGLRKSNTGHDAGFIRIFRWKEDEDAVAAGQNGGNIEKSHMKLGNYAKRWLCDQCKSFV